MNLPAPWISMALSAIFPLFFCLVPVRKESTLNMRSHPDPARNYEEALRLFETIRSHEPAGINPSCRDQLLAHGTSTEHAVILVHGYTSAPPQFQELGRQLFDTGSNVLIARLPHHGLAMRMTREHGKLKACELAACANLTVDIAAGLGRRVVMMGLSAGGVTTAWAVQNRKEIDLGIIISPAFGFRKIPSPLTWPAMVFYRIIPDAFEWWDPAAKENGAPPYAYPVYSRHALTEVLRLGFVVKDEAGSKPPAAKKIILVLNPNDDMISNDMSEKIATLWTEHGAEVSTFTFDAGLKLPHDLITPDQKGQHIDIVYPELIRLAGL